MLRNRGPLTVGAGQVGGGACTEYAKTAPDIQFNVMPLSSTSPYTSTSIRASLSVWQLSQRAAALRSARPIHSTSRASSRITASELCRKTMRRHCKIREIHEQPAFRNGGRRGHSAR